MRDIVLRSVLPVREQGDNEAGKRACETPGSVPCELQLMINNFGKCWAIVAFIVLASPLTFATAQETSHQKIAKQSQIKRLKKGITAQQSKIKAKTKKELSLYSELQTVDNLLADKQKSNISSQEKLLKQERFLQEKELELNFCQSDKQQAEKHIKNRLQAFYKTGDIGIINVLFSSSTLPDFLNTKEYFRSILQHDQLTIKHYRDKLAILNGARSEILNGKEQLLKTIVALKNHEKELIKVRQERKLLLSKIQTEKKLYTRALHEMETSAKNLALKLQSYKTAPVIRPRNKKKRISQDVKQHRPQIKKEFIDFKGRLPAPINNAKLSSKYGTIKGVFGAPIHSNGIDFLVTKSSKVTAIYQGKVVYSGEMAGYGNIVIISHGQQYFTLYSHLTTIVVTRDILLKQGSQIGTITQSQSGILQKGLHLEIRNGSSPENPLLWLDKSQIKQ